MIKPITYPAVLGLGFRPFFLLGSLGACVFVALWVASLHGLAFSPYGGGMWWHAHEMLFGFVAAIVIGFLLTAVQNWTGIPSIKNGALLCLVLLWLLARGVFLFPELLPVEIGIVADLLLFPLTAFFLGRPILKKRQWRNVFFVPFLTVFFLANCASHFYLAKGGWQGIQATNYFTIIIVVALISLMAGRVIPFFTANATGVEKVLLLKWMEIAIVVLHAFIAVTYLSAFDAGSMVTCGLWGAIAFLHFWRWVRWQNGLLYKNPLLWSLHLGYLFLPLGACMMAWQAYGQTIALSTSMHMLLVGAIGGVVLAMIVRVSHGHTGRPLTASKPMVLAFSLVLFCAIIRSLCLALFPGSSSLWLSLSGGVWSLAFFLFFLYYLPVLGRPRVDGKPG